MTLEQLQNQPTIDTLLAAIEKHPPKRRELSYYLPGIVKLREMGFKGREISEFLAAEGCGKFPPASIFKILRKQK